MAVSIAIISKNDGLAGLLSQHPMPGDVTFSADIGGADFVVLDDEEAVGEFDDNCTLYLSPGVGKYSLAKPFRIADLFALLVTMMAGAVHCGEVEVGAYKFNYAKKILLDGGREINLTEKEAEIIMVLLGARPNAVDKKELLGSVWGYDDSIDTHTLETHMYRLRKKMGDEKFIVTDKDGYKIS